MDMASLIKEGQRDCPAHVQTIAVSYSVLDKGLGITCSIYACTVHTFNQLSLSLYDLVAEAPLLVVLEDEEIAFQDLAGKGTSFNMVLEGAGALGDVMHFSSPLRIELASNFLSLLTSCSLSSALLCTSTFSISSSCTLHSRDRISLSSSLLIRFGSSWKAKKVLIRIIQYLMCPTCRCFCP